MTVDHSLTTASLKADVHLSSVSDDVGVASSSAAGPQAITSRTPYPALKPMKDVHNNGTSAQLGYTVTSTLDVG